MSWRKKQIEVEAFALPPVGFAGPEAVLEGLRGAPTWVTDALARETLSYNWQGWRVRTLEGTLGGNVGDYLVRGVVGEIYPVAARIFEATYEWVGRTVEFTVPDRVPPTLNLWSRDWMMRARKNADWKWLVKANVPRGTRMFNEPVEVVLRFFTGYRKTDADNLPKFVLDGLCGCVIADDGPGCVRRLILESRPLEPVRTEILVRAVDA